MLKKKMKKQRKDKGIKMASKLDLNDDGKISQWELFPYSQIHGWISELYIRSHLKGWIDLNSQVRQVSFNLIINWRVI